MSIPVFETTESLAPISSKETLIATLASGSRPKSAWTIGTEHEKFPFLKDTLSPVPYHGPRSISALLTGLRDRFGWTPLLDGPHIIGLLHPEGKGAISLEPGGQFELSGAPLKTLHDTALEIDTHLDQVTAVGDALGIGFLGLGFTPTWTRAQMPTMPKGRYGIMAPYMDLKGSLGRDMMFRSATVQVNLDFSDEADMVKKMRVSLALQPLATALFAASPFTEGRPNGYQSFRSAVWLDTDPDRTGLLPFVFEEGFGFERYVDYALDVPMYFVYRDGKYINTAGRSFRDFLKGHLPELPGQIPILKDWSDHLTTIFPEVRLKTFLEMRGADAGHTRDALCALPAFWVGLLYHTPCLDAAWDLVSPWTEEDRQTVRASVPRLGLKGEIGGKRLEVLAKEILSIAQDGLKARNALDDFGNNETHFLEVLQDRLSRKSTFSDDLLALYHGPWNQDTTPLYDHCAF